MLVTTHACSHPTAKTRAPTSPVGTANCACALEPPQQTTPPACDSAHVKLRPAPMVRMPQCAEDGTSAWSASFAPTQTTSPQSDTAHACESPTATLLPMVAAQAMLADGGTGETLAVELAVRLRVLLLVSDCVQLGATVLEGVPGGVANTDGLTVTAGVLVLVGLPVLTLVGELLGVWDRLAEGEGAPNAGLYGGITTPRKKVWLGAVAITLALMLPLALTTRNTVEMVEA